MKNMINDLAQWILGLIGKYDATADVHALKVISGVFNFFLGSWTK